MESGIALFMVLNKSVPEVTLALYLLSTPSALASRFLACSSLFLVSFMEEYR